MYIYCLPFEGKRRPTEHVDFGAQSLSVLFPNCLHLRNIVTFISPKLATSDAATSYWVRFPLTNLYTLLGVPFVLPIHNQGVSLAPRQGLCPMENIPADYWLILCFFILLTSLPVTAPFGGRFPVHSTFLQPSCVAEFNLYSS